MPVLAYFTLKAPYFANFCQIFPDFSVFLQFLGCFARVCALFVPVLYPKVPQNTLVSPCFAKEFRVFGGVAIFLEKSGESRVKRAQNGSKVVKKG